MGNGGAFRIWPGSRPSLHIFGSVMRNNSAAQGGTFYLSDGVTSLASSTVTESSAVNGSAFYIMSGNVSLVDCEISSNTAARLGAAFQLCTDVGACMGANLELTLCDLLNNVAHFAGGAVFAFGGSVSVESCRIIGNRADLGGALHPVSGTLRVLNTLK